jgi:hypothetical protein
MPRTQALPTRTGVIVPFPVRPEPISDNHMRLIYGLYMALTHEIARIQTALRNRAGYGDTEWRLVVDSLPCPVAVIASSNKGAS